MNNNLVRPNTAAATRFHADQEGCTRSQPLARYSAIEGALASGFASAELHHLWGRDLKLSRLVSSDAVSIEPLSGLRTLAWLGAECGKT
ncbi:MAG: hypothetical protein EOS34_31645 [Mesorhizobium sp.]|nr:MAG: hypothetical protein EOS34_31645 [Mesorhizobium sp.]